MEKLPKVLIGSAIRQKPTILKEFLSSLSELERSGLQIDCLFVDNNEDQDSKKLLKGFKLEGSSIFIEVEQPIDIYYCDETTHYWNNNLIWKLANLKNHILKFALDNDYSHVFLVDSDLVLHPLTLKQLLSADKDIISEIFWTAWSPDVPKMPQVWQSGQYSFHHGDKTIPEDDKIGQSANFIAHLKIPGVYEVGGLGACTLISTKAIAKGLSYSKISNVDYWGEDRHFCVRAAVLGFRLYVDTNYPAFHIYRDSDLQEVSKFKSKAIQALTDTKSDSLVENNMPGTSQSLSQDIGLAANKNSGWQRKSKENRLTLAMIVRNEGNRYLRKVLEKARQYIDGAVIIDDASNDNTIEVCREVLKNIPLKLITQKKSTFSTEHKLRKKLWLETIKTNPDWVMILDADEMFEDTAATVMPKIINQSDYDVIYFRLYDFWNENSYREDRFWKAHSVYRPFMVRYIPGFDYKWLETPIHCGRFPCNINELKGASSGLRLKHFGWATPEDRESKYKRYMKTDPEGKYGIMEQYMSILDTNPNLVRWTE